MGVITNGLICENKPLNIVIFSHGFSAHRKSYTSFTKELASLGYIVFCPEHYEPIKIPGYGLLTDPVEKLAFIKEKRGNHLD